MISASFAWYRIGFGIVVLVTWQLELVRPDRLRDRRDFVGPVYPLSARLLFVAGVDGNRSLLAACPRMRVAWASVFFCPALCARAAHVAIAQAAS